MTPDQFRAALDRLDISQEGFARLLRLGTGGGTTVSRWMLGQRKLPDYAAAVAEWLEAGSLPDIEPYRRKQGSRTDLVSP